MTNEHMGAWARLAEENVALKSEIAEYEDLQRKAVDELVRLRTELARLRTALESAQADRHRAVDDLFAQLRVNASLRAESMRGAVEELREKAKTHRSWSPDANENFWTTVANWLEQQAASQGQPLENIEGLTQAQPVCRASQGPTKNGDD